MIKDLRFQGTELEQSLALAVCEGLEEARIESSWPQLFHQQRPWILPPIPFRRHWRIPELKDNNKYVLGKTKMEMGIAEGAGSEGEEKWKLGMKVFQRN